MASHPLEPLSADEFQQTAEILRRERGITESYRFASIELQEPTKAAVKSWSPMTAVGTASPSGTVPRQVLRPEPPTSSEQA